MWRPRRLVPGASTRAGQATLTRSWPHGSNSRCVSTPKAEPHFKPFCTSDLETVTRFSFLKPNSAALRRRGPHSALAMDPRAYFVSPSQKVSRHTFAEIGEGEGLGRGRTSLAIAGWRFPVAALAFADGDRLDSNLGLAPQLTVKTGSICDA